MPRLIGYIDESEIINIHYNYGGDKLITVIKPGKRSKENYYIGKCWWCEAKFIFEECDVQAIDNNKYNVDKGPKISHYVDCPECGRTLFKDDHDFVELPKYKYDKLLRKAKRRNNDECSCSKRREIRKPRR